MLKNILFAIDYVMFANYSDRLPSVTVTVVVAVILGPLVVMLLAILIIRSETVIFLVELKASYVSSSIFFS